MTAQNVAHTTPLDLQTSHPSGIFRAASWRALLYVIVDLPWTILAFTMIFTLMTVGASLTIIYVGIPISLLAMLIARGAGIAQCGLTSGLLGWRFATLASRKRGRPGLWGMVVDTISDPVAWRALGYFTLKLLLAPINFAIAITFYSGLGMITYPVWRPFLPEVLGTDGGLHRGASLWQGMFIDTWPSMTVFALIGALLLLCGPYVMRGFLRLDFLAIRGLLTARRHVHPPTL